MTEPQKRSGFDWGLGALAVVGVGAATWLYTVILPQSDVFDHLAHAQQRLPFTVHFALTAKAGPIASFVASVLLIAAAVMRLSKRPGASRILLVLAATTPLVVMAIGLAGVRVADQTCAFPPSPGLERCECPADAFPQPLECHCDQASNVKELLLSGDDVEEWPVAQRLFAGGDPRIERLTVRDAIRIEGDQAIGETLSIEGQDRKITCNYPEPCEQLRLGVCGPCALGDP